MLGWSRADLGLFLVSWQIISSSGVHLPFQPQSIASFWLLPNYTSGRARVETTCPELLHCVMLKVKSVYIS